MKALKSAIVPLTREVCEHRLEDMIARYRRGPAIGPSALEKDENDEPLSKMQAEGRERARQQAARRWRECAHYCIGYFQACLRESE